MLHLGQRFAESPLGLREFLSFLQLRFFVATGWHMQALIVSWFIYAQTHDPLMLALVGLAEAVPAIGAALPMGYLVEGMEKRKALRIGSGLIIFSAVVSALLMQPMALRALGHHAVLTGLYLMIMVNGTARSMYSPAMFSTLSRIVPRSMIPRASAMSSTVWQTAAITGPLTAGLLYGFTGVGIASAVYVVLMVVGSLGVFGLTPKPPLTGSERGRMRDDLTQGLRFIIGNRIILGALSLDLFAVLFGGVTALLPVFADTVLHVGEQGLGVLRASMSIGSVAMMAWLSVRPPSRNAGRIMLAAVAGFGCCMIGFALSEVFVLSAILLVAAGMFDSVSVVTRQTILQLETPEHMKGRVAAANTMFVSSSNELGAAESGLAARVLGTVPSVVFGGIMTLVIVTVVAATAPALRRMHIAPSDPDKAG